ncbi:MAG: acyl-CoA dehydrogenase C-terminal domain-containing protein [Gammaproteobacteria bacterium]
MIVTASSHPLDLLSALQNAGTEFDHSTAVGAGCMPSALLTAYRNYRLVLRQARAATALTETQNSTLKKLLLQQKASVESGLTLCYYLDHCAREASGTPTASLLAFLTPVQQHYCAVYSQRVNHLAGQTLALLPRSRDAQLQIVEPVDYVSVAGGADVQQWLQDCVFADTEAGIFLFRKELRATVKRARGFIDDSIRRSLSLHWDQLESLLAQWQRRWDYFDTALFLNQSEAVLDVLAVLCSAWLWLEQATRARCRLLDRQPLSMADKACCRGTIQTCLYVYQYELPGIEQQLALLTQLDPICLDMELDWF